MYPDNQNNPDSSNQGSYPQPIQGSPMPQATDAMFQVQPEEPNKKKRLLVGIIIGAALLLVIASAALYFVITYTKSEPESAQKKPEPLTSTAVIVAIEESLSDKFLLKEPVDGEAVSKPVIKISHQDLSPSYSVEGYHFAVQYDSKSSFTYEVVTPIIETLEKTAAMPVASDLILDKLKVHSLPLVSGGTSQAGNTTTEEGGTIIAPIVVAQRHEGRGVVCTVNAENTEGGQRGSVSCGEVAEFKKASAEFQPFADGITGLEQGSTLRGLEVTNSDSGGYQRASLTVIDPAKQVATAHFYKKESGRWLHLTTSAELKLACTVYATLEAQRSFLNTPCADATNPNATVQVAQKKR